MSINTPPTSSQPPAATTVQLPAERLNFKTNLLKNPNYYGTFAGLGEIVKAIQGNTTYEQLLCLGLNPNTSPDGTLETVIQINQASGYDSGPCGSGSTEWVRFYVLDGSTWTDLGSTSVNVFNLTGSTLPVCYAVEIDLPEVKKFCFTENVLSVRAILSWELEPPANSPNFIPVWGNVVNAKVQIAPEFFSLVPISVLATSGLVKIDPSVEAAIDLSKTLPAKSVAPLSYGELKTLYANHNVPSHRFGFSAAQKLQTQSVSKLISVTEVSKGLQTTNLSIGADLSAILVALETPNYNTTYEQLTCAGYNPQTRTLEAVIEVKLNSGFSGGLCTPGSYEYVSFFAFFNGAWQSLGTAQVNVHDLQSVTAGNSVYYAVARLSALTSEACANLQSVPLRAILSWEAIPTGPDYIPFWGNVLNTNVQPQIGDSVTGEHARLLRIGEVGIVGIQKSSNADLSGDYLANATGVAGDCNNAYDSPFAGTIDIEADFTPKPFNTFDPVTGAKLPGAHPIIYQAFITRPDSTSFQLTNSFGIGVFPSNAPISNPEVVITQAPVASYGPVNGGAPGATYYTYYESGEGQLVDPRVVASFEAGGLPEGNYTITLQGYVWDGVIYQPLAQVAQQFYVYNGYQPGGDVPLTSINLTSAADCGNVTQGAVITGSYSVTDEFFGSVTLELAPTSISGNPIILPTIYLSNQNDGPDSVVYNGANTFGTSGTFTIYTGNYDPNKDPSKNNQPNQPPLPACGYTIQLWAYDRALVDTTCNHHGKLDGTGFCLVAPKSA